MLVGDSALQWSKALGQVAKAITKVSLSSSFVTDVRNVLTLDARHCRTLGARHKILQRRKKMHQFAPVCTDLHGGTYWPLFFAGSSSVGLFSFRLKIIMGQNGEQPILLATSPIVCSFFGFFLDHLILICLSVPRWFFWSDPGFLSSDVWGVWFLEIEYLVISKLSSQI